MAHIPFSRLNTMTNGGESASPAAKTSQCPLLAESKPCTGISQIVLAGSSLLISRRPLYRVRSWQLASGTSLPARDPLYTGSLLVVPPKEHLAEPCIQLQGEMLRSRLLRLTHILGCIQLGQFVQ
jgi:hypothetical protein